MQEEGSRVFARLRVEQTPSAADSALLATATTGFSPFVIRSQGGAELEVLPRALLTGLRPPVVLNLATVTWLAVTGEDFSKEDPQGPRC